MIGAKKTEILKDRRRGFLPSPYKGGPFYRCRKPIFHKTKSLGQITDGRTIESKYEHCKLCGYRHDVIGMHHGYDMSKRKNKKKRWPGMNNPHEAAEREYERRDRLRRYREKVIRRDMREIARLNNPWMIPTVRELDAVADYKVSIDNS